MPLPAKLVASSGLWRSPVAHLVRIEGVWGSNPHSSTEVIAGQRPCPRKRPGPLTVACPILGAETACCPGSQCQDPRSGAPPRAGVPAASWAGPKMRRRLEAVRASNPQARRTTLQRKTTAGTQVLVAARRTAPRMSRYRSGSRARPTGCPRDPVAKDRPPGTYSSRMGRRLRIPSSRSRTDACGAAECGRPGTCSATIGIPASGPCGVAYGVQVHNSDASGSVMVGIGHERSFVDWLDNSGARESGSDPDVPAWPEPIGFDLYGNWHEYEPDDTRVSSDTARQAAREYVATGARPPCVGWQAAS